MLAPTLTIMSIVFILLFAAVVRVLGTDRGYKVLFVVIAFAVMLACIAHQAVGAATVISYALFYFLVFATRGPLVKALVIIMLITAAQACLEQRRPGWHPSFTSGEAAK